MSSKISLLVATAMALAPSASLARDGAPYVGIEGGVVKPEKLKLDYQLRSLALNDGIVLEHRTGFDVDLIAGYDFGRFRAEGELGWKRANARDVSIAPAINFNNTGRLAIDGNTRVLSAMANLLIDLGADDGLQVYGGGGVGAARLSLNNAISGPGVIAGRGINGKDGSLAWQAIAGMRVPVSDGVDLGLKYRYFRSKFKFQDATNPAAIETLNGAFRSHSILASLIFNFGGAPVPPPPPPPAPMAEVAPPPPPATQTCPDGTVILASDACPALPPPPPPPPAAPERG